MWSSQVCEVARAFRCCVRRFLPICTAWPVAAAAADTPLLPPTSIAQVRRDNAILLGAGTLKILAGLLVRAGLAWWAL
jgi:hypothetical protein